MILSDVNVPKIGESDLRDIVVGSVELKPYDRTYTHGYTQQRGMLRLEVVFNDDLTVGISSEIKDEICSKLESAVQALKSRISRICGINEWGESGRGEALSGSFLGREGPQKSTPYPGFKLEFKKHTSNPKMQLRTRGGFLNLKSKLHLSFTNVPHAVH